MKKEKAYLMIILWAIGHPLFAQIAQKNLIGEWRLESLIEKQISASEKQKRYVFTVDSLLYRSARKNIDGTYVLQQQTLIISWKIPGFEKPLIINIENLNQDTLRLKETGENAVTGILIRLSAIGKQHFQTALKAEIKKDFRLAFTELKKASEYHYPDAMYRLAMYYFTGTVTTLDEKEGSKWIKAAASLGNGEAQAIVSSGSLKY